MENNIETVKKIVLCILIILVFIPSLIGLPIMTMAGFIFFIPLAIFVLIWLPRLFFLTITDFDLGLKYSAYTVGFIIIIYIFGFIYNLIDYKIKVNRRKHSGINNSVYGPKTVFIQ